MSKNANRDTIIYSLELSKRSKVPILFFSGPGWGKTTGINLYAAKNNYHVETVCGSQYAKDEILGFLVNEGSESLTAKVPEWYSNIIKQASKGQPSILFFDEISAASTEVQSSLLQVCFERKIRGGRLLPEDTIICAAANYKFNLPGWCDIMSPQLNRFCIINLQPETDEDQLDLIDEFLQDMQEVDDDWPEIADIDTSSIKSSVVNQTNKLFKSLWKKYPRDINSKIGQTIGALNFRNQCLDGMYAENDDGYSPVLNVITGRSMSYISRVFAALYSMGFDGTNPAFVSRAVDGMMGLGTNSWSDDPEDRWKQITSFRELIHEKANKLLSNLAGNTAKGKLNSAIYTSDLQGKIIELITSYESGDGEDIDADSSEVYKMIDAAYTSDVQNTLKYLDGSTEKLGIFTSEYEAMLRLVDFFKDNFAGSNAVSLLYHKTKEILKIYSAYYQAAFIE